MWLHSLVLFDPYIESYQVLPLQARMELGAMKPYHQIV